MLSCLYQKLIWVLKLVQGLGCSLTFCVLNSGFLLVLGGSDLPVSAASAASLMLTPPSFVPFV